MKTKIVLLGLFLSVVVIGCNKDDNNTKSTMSVEEATANTKMDIANDDVSKVVEDQLGEEDGISGRGTTGTQGFLPACATVTRVPEAGTAIVAGTLITKTIDFGTAGCAMPNGNVLKGKIIITFNYQPTSTSHTINYSFVGFYHNSIMLEGNKTFTRVMSAATATSASHPIVTMNLDMTATFLSGNTYHRVGTRIREIVAGYDTSVLTDNVYSVTGNWTTTFPSTTVQNSTITTPLVVKLSCNHIVKGVVTSTRNGNVATLDYGNGDCDNLAVFTFNGVAHNIVLGN
jgi:hypothetical protein